MSKRIIKNKADFDKWVQDMGRENTVVVGIPSKQPDAYPVLAVWEETCDREDEPTIVYDYVTVDDAHDLVWASTWLQSLRTL